jgi:hypothetical protein
MRQHAQIRRIIRLPGPRGVINGCRARDIATFRSNLGLLERIRKPAIPCPGVAGNENPENHKHRETFHRSIIRHFHD